MDPLPLKLCKIRNSYHRAVNTVYLLKLNVRLSDLQVALYTCTRTHTEWFFNLWISESTSALHCRARHRVNG